MVCWRDLQFEKNNMHQLYALYGSPDDLLADEYRARFDKKTRRPADPNEEECGISRQIIRIGPKDDWGNIL